jgi:hypothetical protein
MDVNGLLTKLVLGNKDANTHHQLNDATDTVSATVVAPSLRALSQSPSRMEGRCVRNDQLN